MLDDLSLAQDNARRDASGRKDVGCLMNFVMEYERKGNSTAGDLIIDDPRQAQLCLRQDPSCSFEQGWRLI